MWRAALILWASADAADAECGDDSCSADGLKLCGQWCEDAGAEDCLMDTALMPCRGEHCRTTCRRWFRSMLAPEGSVNVTCQEFSDFTFFPRGAAVCKEECLLPEIRPERYPNPTGLGLLCRPNSCDASSQARYANSAFGGLGLGVLQCPCNWFGSDCRDAWVPVLGVEKLRLGDFQETSLRVDTASWRRIMRDYRPGAILRVQRLDENQLPREQPFALAGKSEEGLLEILTGPPPAKLHPVVTHVATALRMAQDDRPGGFFVNPVISGFFNGRFQFLDALASPRRVAIVSSGVGLSGALAAVAHLASRTEVHLFYGLRHLKDLPYQRRLESQLATGQLKLRLLVSGSAIGASELLQQAADKGAQLAEAASKQTALQQFLSGKIYPQHALALDFLTGELAGLGATLADTAVVICGRQELLQETPRLLEALCHHFGQADCSSLIQAHVFTNI